MMTDVSTKVCKILSDMDGRDVTPDMKLMADLEMDSLDNVEMVMAIEVEFPIEVPDEVADEWFSNGKTTVKDVIAWVESKL